MAEQFLRVTGGVAPGRRGRGKPKAIILIAVLFLLATLVLAGGRSSADGPPEARRDNVKEVIDGVEVVDPYRWLEDRESPETHAWIENQNKYSRSVLQALPGRERIQTRLAELMKVDTFGLPVERNGRYFFSKRLKDQELPVLYLRKASEGRDEVLVDPHPMSADHSISVELEGVSENGELLAYGVRHGGEDEVAVHVLDVDSKKDLPDRLPKARYFGVSFTRDHKGMYYTREEKEGSRIHFHALGADPALDTEVFGKGYGPDKIIVSEVSEDGRFLIIHVFYGSAADKTEVYFQDLEKRGPIVPVVNDLDARFHGEAAGDTLFLQTNWKAPKGRILAVDLRHSERDHWREIIHESDAVIDDFSLAGKKIFVQYLQNVRSALKVFEPDGRAAGEIALPALGSILGVSGEWKSPEVFFEFDSFHIPRTIYSYHAGTRRQSVWARPTVPIESEKFEVNQVWYESKDGTKVPMFLVHKRGVKLDGSNPAMLTGYGGFNLSMTPQFSPRAVVWIERGGVFALPNLRGGGEFGEEWHRAGMFEKKQNVFDDFIAAAQWLIEKRYTNPSKLAISGRSNGGLLVGAALTQHPGLFQAVVCGYPLLDMLRYQKFLVAQFWVSEYGSSEDPNQFKYLHAYSPYHHVTAGTKYPAVLFVTGDGDTRVDPLHARKMCALLQSATGSDRPVLLRYDTQAGHTPAEPVSKQIDEMVDELSFLFWQLHIAE